MRLWQKLLLAPAVFVRWGRSAGWRAAARFAVYRAQAALGLRQPSILRIQPRQARYPLLARSGDSSDLPVFSQVFLSEEYAPLRNISPARLFLDLGANVGYSSAWFLSRYPDATVVAVEPDPSNYELCRRNLAPYGDRAQVVLGAVWSRRCKLVLARGRRQWATQVHESGGSGSGAIVDAWDIPSLLYLSGGDSIDLLKIDIEGSELELFRADFFSWLPKVRNICVELHGDECRRVFMRALEGFEYDSEISGELTVCRNLRRKAGLAAGGA